MNFQNPTLTPTAANMRIRILWRDFERSQAKDRAQLDITVQAALEKAETEWIKTPSVERMSRIRHHATKARIVKTIKSPYFEKARAQWHQKLESLRLKADYWTDLTEDEKRRITNILGAEDESDEEAVVSTELPPPPPAPILQSTQTPFLQPVALSFSTSSRATNLSASSYAFVNPSEFNSEDEDFEFEIPFSNPVATSADLTSEDDDDAAFSIPGHPATRPSIIGSGFSRTSSSHNPVSKPSKPPSSRPLVSGFAYNAAAPNGALPTKRQQVSPTESKPAPTKARIPRQPYVGPSLDAPDEPINEELEFERFKMRTRMAKIVEFHEAAALAEISLSIEIYKARKQLNNSKEEDAPRVLDHQKRMLQLQKEKEEERKAIVKSERARRQSDLGRRLTPGDVKDDHPMSNAAFKPWELASFQEEINLPARFNLDTLLSDDPAKQHTNVESLLSEMFADDYQPPYSESSAPNGGYSSASSNPDAFRGSASIHGNQQQLRHSHSSMSWNKPPSNPSPKPSRKTRLSPFGESSDEEDGTPVKRSTRNTNETAGPIWNNKPNSATTSAWPSKDVGTTPVNSAWSRTPITQSHQGPNMNPHSFFVPDEIIEAEPIATPVMNSKAAKGKKPSVSTFGKSPEPPSLVAPTTKAPPAETTVVPPPETTPAPVSAPVGKKQGKKQRQANKKGGTVAAPAAIPEKQPSPEPVPPQRESPKLETTVAAPDPVIPGGSEHTSWLPKMVPAMARARMDSGPPTPSFNWDEITSTPRPASKIPAHVQETLKLEGTLRPSMLKKHNIIMAEVLGGATSSRTTLEQMPPPAASIAKGPPAWASPSPGPSLWGKTKADFETAKQPVGGNFWVPEGFDGADNKDDGGGGGGGGGEEGVSLWESSIGKTASIPVKQQQPSVGSQRLRRVSEAAASFPAPRALGSKDPTDIGQAAPPTVNSNSKKARGKKNGKGKQRGVTMEEVSDEEKDNIDILPENSHFIMEPKATILEPKPSVPSVAYNPIIDFAGSSNSSDVNDIGYYSSSSFRPTTASTRTASNSSSPEDFFGSETRFFKTQGGNPSTIGADWGGKHARWTPAVNHDREESGSPNYPPSLVPRKPSVQQTPIWGQPNPSKDKGKGKK